MLQNLYILNAVHVVFKTVILIVLILHNITKNIPKKSYRPQTLER